jgi:hypothetical protein
VRDGLKPVQYGFRVSENLQSTFLKIYRLPRSGGAAGSALALCARARYISGRNPDTAQVRRATRRRADSSK